MAINKLSFDDWNEWFRQISHPATLKEMALLLLAGCLAYLLVRQLRRIFYSEDAHVDMSRSVLFGSRSYDGVLFPAFWVLLAHAAPWILQVEARFSIFRVALPVLWALLVIRAGVKLLRAAFEQARWVRMLEHTVSWIVWLGAVLWVSGIFPVLLEQLEDIKFKLGNSNTSARTIVEGLAMVAVTLLVSLWLSSAIERRLLRRATGSVLSFRKIVANLTRALLLVMAVIISMSIAGIDLTALSVFGGALGVGIGLGLQKLAANYVSGFVILAERSIRIGDLVKVDGFEGRISDISARYTVIRSFSGVEAILPNETLVTQRVENNSLADRQVWLSTTVSVAYDSDVELVQQLLVDAALAQPRVMRDPGPTANLENFGPDGLEFRLGFWILDPEIGSGVLRSAINTAILKSLREHDIEIPYPQRVVRHMRADGAGPAVAATEPAGQGHPPLSPTTETANPPALLAERGAKPRPEPASPSARGK